MPHDRFRAAARVAGRIAFGLITVLIAFGLREAFLPVGHAYAYLTFYPAVTIAAYSFGAPAGLAATAASALIAAERYQLAAPGGLTLVDQVALLVFLVSGCAVSALAEARIRATRTTGTALAEAESARRARDRFFAAVSHELRTPLTAIVGWANMLGDGKVPPERVPHAIAVIRRNANIQKQMTEDLLDYTRITAGQLTLVREPVDLGAVVGDAAEIVRLAADAKGVNLTIEPPADPVSVTGDQGRLRQVIWNLLTNAVKFTEKGGAVRVRWSMNGTAKVIVEDTGIGIDAALLPAIFDPFRQGDPRHVDGVSGVGLGLSIVRYLVEAHGGQVSATSGGTGRGATFTVTLPPAHA